MNGEQLAKLASLVAAIVGILSFAALTSLPEWQRALNLAIGFFASGWLAAVSVVLRHRRRPSP